MTLIEQPRVSVSRTTCGAAAGGQFHSTLHLFWLRCLAIATALALLLLYAGTAEAQSQAPQQGWAGIVPASNDYTNPVAYETPQLACESLQNSFVPNFGYQVFELLQASPRADDINPYTGAKAPAVGCEMNAGDNGTATVIAFYGCDSAYKLAHGACLPPSYPITGEPMCKGNKGGPGQFPAVGDPCSLSSGAKIETVTDYTSGGPYPIEIKRHYRSMMMPNDPQGQTMGMAWRSDLIGRRAFTESFSLNRPYNVVISREDGSQVRFLNPDIYATNILWTRHSVGVYINNGQQYVQGQSDGKDTFKKAATTRWEYTDENDRVDTFGSSPQAILTYPSALKKSVWKGGYERNYVYDPSDTFLERPIQINDSIGRIIDITWTGSLITSIQVPGGTKIQYSYEPRMLNGNPVAGTEVLTQVARYKSDGALIDATTYQYDRSRTSTTVPLLTGVIDAKGVLIDSTTYDVSGRVLTAQGPNGANAISVVYNDASSTRTVTNALGQVEVYTMEGGTAVNSNVPPIFKLKAIARQASSSVPAATSSQTRDVRGFVGSRTNWNGVVTNFTNDANGNETQRIEDANGVARTVSTTWSPTFRVPTQIVAPNLTTNFTYDTAGRLTRREEIDTSQRTTVTRAWTYTWTALGLLQTVTGPRTDVVQTTTFTYDAAGNLATVQDALNRITTVTAVNAAGLPTSVTDPNNVVTVMTYDPLNRIKTVSVQGPVPATTSFGYDEDGLLTSVTSPTNVALTYGYDAAHRLTSIADGAGNKSVFALDGLGNRTQTQIQSVSAQVLMANSAAFDSLGRLLSNIGAVNQTTRYEYDNNSNLTKLIDPRNAATQLAFDGLNRVKQTTDALNGVTKAAYNLQDNVTSVTDAKLHATTYTVNGFGFVTQIVSPDTGTTTYTYDLAGNIRSRKDARNVVTNYTYDALDRPLTRTFPSATADNVTYGYDSTASGNVGIGRLTSLTDSAGTASFTYDAYGNRTAERRTIAGIAYNTAYDYDLSGLLTKITYPSGRIVTYQRDALGQVAAVTTQADSGAAAVTLASGLGYRPFGPMETATLGNGVQLLNEYDLDYRLARSRATGAAALQDLTYGYDAASNVNAINDSVTANLSQTFQYDLVGRVTQGTGAFGTDNYTYDALGNRLTRSLVNGGTTATTYTYTAANTRLLKSVTGSATLNYAYDANGSLLTRKLGNTTQAAYVHNADARLASSGTTVFKYNAFGQRSIQTVTGGGTHFIFDENGMLLAEHGTTGAVVRNYVYLNGLPLAVIDNAGAVNYVLNDHIGQPQKMANASGALNWHRVAGLFGDTVSQPVGSTATNPQRFPGQQHDPFTALHYNYFRDYDPATGRYIEADPIGLDGGMNLYAYTGGNPVNRIDPSGEFWWIAGGAATGGGTELFSQAWRNAQRGQLFNKDCYDWNAVGREAGFGAATGGLGRVASVGRNGVRAAKASPATGFRGSKRFELRQPDYQPVRNTPGNVGGRDYSGHAFDQMQNRGIMPSVVDNTIRTGTTFPSRAGTTGYYDAMNNVQVITNSSSGRIITVIPGKP